MPIVAATAGDEADLRRLLDAAGLPTADLTSELLRSFLVQREGPDLVAVGGLELVGEDALVRSVAVAPSQRGRGLGRQVVRALEELARGRVAFSGTETWRTVYERILRSQGLKTYHSVSWVKTRDYWQDAPGRQSMRLNFELAGRGLRIERIVILRGDLWPDGMIHIERRVYRGIVDSPKSRRSRRPIPPTAITRELLDRLLELLPDRRPSAWLFPSEAGHTPSNHPPAKPEAFGRFAGPSKGPNAIAKHRLDRS